jgi:hypothetical protein
MPMRDTTSVDVNMFIVASVLTTFQNPTADGKMGKELKYPLPIYHSMNEYEHAYGMKCLAVLTHTTLNGFNSRIYNAVPCKLFPSFKDGKNTGTTRFGTL